MVLTAVFCTVTFTTAFSPLTRVIMILALPVFFAVIFPRDVTVATFLLDVVQDCTLSPAARPLTCTLVVDCFFFNLMLLAFSLIVGVSLLPTVRVS